MRSEDERDGQQQLQSIAPLAIIQFVPASQVKPCRVLLLLLLLKSYTRYKHGKTCVLLVTSKNKTSPDVYNNSYRKRRITLIRQTTMLERKIIGRANPRLLNTVALYGTYIEAR